MKLIGHIILQFVTMLNNIVPKKCSKYLLEMTMFRLRNLTLIISISLLGISLTACDRKAITNAIGSKKIDCLNESGNQSVLATLTDNAEKAIKGERDDISISEIRAAINNLKLSTKNVRTSKEDPNSTKVFCEAEVTISTPVNMINDANEALKASGNDKKIDLILEDYGLKPSSAAANSYEGTISYNIQPTDDGKTILSSIDDGNDQLVSGIKDIVLWSKAKKDIGKSKAEATSQDSKEARANAQANIETTKNAQTTITSANPTGIICSYQAQISENDKYNSSGSPVATAYNQSSVAAILRQDRANFHKFNLRDLGDTDDCMMGSSDQRANFEKLLRNGAIDSATIAKIVDGNPTVNVDLYSNHADVKVY